jgi:hypothetical protein
MRSYPRNSPAAAARIVALAAIVDGHLSPAELGVLDRLDAHRRLGLDPLQMHEVIRELTEDLLATACSHWDAACRIDGETLSALMREVDDPQLRETVLHLCLAVAQVDDHWSDDELWIIAAASNRWQLPALPG